MVALSNTAGSQQDFASECGRLEEHVAVLARFCPAVVSVEVLLDLALAMESFLRRRRVLVHLVDRRLALALRHQR